MKNWEGIYMKRSLSILLMLIIIVYIFGISGNTADYKWKI